MSQQSEIAGRMAPPAGPSQLRPHRKTAREFFFNLLRAYTRLLGGRETVAEDPGAPEGAQARFAAALRAAVHQSLPLIATGSAAFYFMLALIALLRPEVGGDVLAFSLVSGLAALGVRIAWAYGIIPERWAHSLVGFLTGLLVLHTLWRWALFGRVQEGGLFGMALLIAGSLCLSLPWAIGLTVGGLVLWFGITFVFFHQWPDPYVSAFLLSCPSVAAAVRIARRAMIERMETYRRRDVQQRLELQETHHELETKVQELSEVNNALRREIHERERAEEQMQQHRAELAHTLRVQTVGQMMGSLAHELNQPLAAIANNIEACATYMESAEPDRATMRELMEHATNEALRAGSIVHHLRAFIEKREPQVERTDLCDLARDVIDLLEPELREHEVEGDVSIETPSLPIFGNRIQIEQVIVNLVRNAIDAMDSLEDGVRQVQVRLRETAHEMAELAVIDAGTGLTEAQRARIFEPFFTTKRSGLGLGLAISRSIVEAHHGRLWLEARRDGRPGVVATFELPIRKGGE